MDCYQQHTHVNRRVSTLDKCCGLFCCLFKLVLLLAIKNRFSQRRRPISFFSISQVNFTEVAVWFVSACVNWLWSAAEILLKVFHPSLDTLARQGYFLHNIIAISSTSNMVASLGCCKIWQADLMLETVFRTSLLISS